MWYVIYLRGEYMKIYRTIRQIEEIEVKDEILLGLIQMYNLDDRGIQEARDLKELFDLYGNINEFSPELDILLPQGEVVESIRTYYEDYGDAYHDMEFGIH